MNRLARRGLPEPGSDAFGRAFENWVFHELTAYVGYGERDARLSYWRVHGGVEVDFIIGEMDVAVEAKSSGRIHRGHLRGLRRLKDEYPEVRSRIVVCQEPSAYRTDDGIDVLPVEEFLRLLASGEL